MKGLSVRVPCGSNYLSDIVGAGKNGECGSRVIKRRLGREEKKGCGGWFLHVAVTATLSMLAKAIVVDLERETKRGETTSRESNLQMCRKDRIWVDPHVERGVTLQQDHETEVISNESAEEEGLGRKASWGHPNNFQQARPEINDTQFLRVAWSGICPQTRDGVKALRA